MVVSKTSNEADLEVFAANDVLFLIQIGFNTLSKAGLESWKVLGRVLQQSTNS